MLCRLLHLEQGQLGRALPFFGLYLLLFAALSLLDGLALALFVTRAGAAWLPAAQTVAAVLVLLGVATSTAWADRTDISAVFTVILLVPAVVLLGAGTGLAAHGLQLGWLAAVFVCREVTMTLVLLHFGNFLRDFFPDRDLLRVMPFVYAGGRLGGLFGGGMLERLSGPVGPVPLLTVVAGLLGIAAVVALVLRRLLPLVAEARQPMPGPPPGGFLRLVATDPLLRWITISTVVFFACRTFIVFRTGEFLERDFPDDVVLSEFLGRYTQAATLLSLMLQLLVSARWIAWAGLGAAHATYGALLAVAAALVALPLNLTTTVLVKFVEGELRYSLRNPVSQLTVNLFPRPIRIRARAWSLGLLIPVASGAASVAIAAAQRLGLQGVLGVTTGLLGFGYLLASLGLARAIAGRFSPDRSDCYALGDSRTAHAAASTGEPPWSSSHPGPAVRPSPAAGRWRP
jgi:hypothetical protein